MDEHRNSSQVLTPSVGVVLDMNINDMRSDMEACVDTVRDAVMEHGVCFLRSSSRESGTVIDPDIEDETLVAFAKHFGPLEGPHPIFSPDPRSPLAVVAHDAEKPPDGAEWHTDCSWSSTPPFASVLWPKLLPTNGGGDTLWMSSCAAFDALPEEMRTYLRSLNAVHDMGSLRNSCVRRDGASGITQGHADFGCAICPIVTTHPVTGRSCLFVNEAFTVHVVGLMAGESRRLLNYLFDHIQRPDFQCRWKWQLGDVAIWDNRSTQHYACADYVGFSRRMHRVTVVDDARKRAHSTPTKK